MDSKSPVKIWRDRHSPKSDPIFHISDRFIGDARSMTRLLIALISFRVGVIM